jgi:hypothetical protein
MQYGSAFPTNLGLVRVRVRVREIRVRVKIRGSVRVRRELA